MSSVPVASPIEGAELLARFMTKKDWVRANKSIKQDAFMPPRDLHLSVTRHVNLSEEELWAVGQTVADQISGQTGTAFYGRADMTAARVAAVRPLGAIPHPVIGNPNHAHIDGWPLEKSDQKTLALELAASAGQVVERPAS